MYYIGIDLGGTNIACGLVSVSGEILVKKSCPTGASRPAEKIMADMASLIEKVLLEANCPKEKIAFCGIASPGIANPETGCIEYSCNLPSFLGFPIVEDLKQRMGFSRVGLENDANCAAKGEAEAGAAKGCGSSVLITLGTGVGGGVILNGAIYRGFNFAGAELGHIVIDHKGPVCSCGRRGCWEMYSSATALCRMTREKMKENPDSVMWALTEGQESRVSGRTAFDAMRRKDRAAKEVIDSFVEYLACGITNIINIFQPEILTVGGGISAEGETLLAPVRAIVEREQYSRVCERKTVLKKARLGNDAGIIGAALLWR